MNRSIISAQVCPQPDATKIPADFPAQAPALDLQSRKLRQRFALAPELARTVASLAFAVEARA